MELNITRSAIKSLFLGFYDWDTWWQGEIAAEYFLSNSNNISHQACIHTSPADFVASSAWSSPMRDSPYSSGPLFQHWQF
jgi:hypothetical protein